MHETLDEKLDDIFPVDQKTCIEALKKAQLVPGIPFAAIYTLRLLALQFFRENAMSAAVADDELSSMYSISEDGPTEIIQAEHELEFSESDFTGNPNVPEVIVGPERPMRHTIIAANEVLGPQKVRCD